MRNLDSTFLYQIFIFALEGQFVFLKRYRKGVMKF